VHRHSRQLRRCTVAGFRANLLALSAPAPDSFTAVNICSGQPHTVWDLAEALATAVGGPAPVVVGGARPGDVRHVVASPQRAADLLGFRARVDFVDGVKSLATS
jgi:dTDP-L-rhamnose 4-epimerase